MASDNNTLRKDLGAVSAYAVAVEHGFDGTEAEWEEYIANASNNAAAANTSKLAAEGYAVGKQNGEDVPSTSPYYENNAKYYAEQTEAAKTTAVQAIEAKGEQVLHSIPSEYTELSGDVADLKSALNYCVDNAVVEIEKTVTWQNGYIDISGKIIGSSRSGYALIPMTTGERVVVGTNNRNVTIIGSTNADSVTVGDTVTVIQKTSSSDGFETYTYTATNDINIVVCVLFSDYIIQFYKNAKFAKSFSDEMDEMDDIIYNKCYNGINLIGLDSNVYYPVVVPTGTTLTISTADGEAIGQHGLNLLFYDENKNNISGGGWNFNPSNAKRTITVNNGGNTAYYVKWNTNPSKDVQLEFGDTNTPYTPYCLRINNPQIIKQIYEPSPYGLVEEDIFNGEPYSGSYDWQTPVVAYGALFKDVENVESFAFFTDPHVMGFSGRNEQNMSEYIKKTSKVFRSVPCRFFVCGGDWLNNSTVADEACYRLGYIKALAKNMLCECKMVLGNHDTNYQGKADAESENGTGTLSNATINALMFNDTETRKAYYSFDGIRSKCYVLDTGIEHNTMNEYDWEQVAWFAEKLAEDDAEHSIIFLHIITNNGSVQTNTSNFATLVEAYNDHTTITLNGVLYDFTSCTGRVELWVGGHTHVDSNGTLGGIPYIITGSIGYNSDVPLIDLAVVDYDNHVLKTIRVGGTGSNRTISLVT